MTTYKLRKQIIHYCYQLDIKGFVANHDGNCSARLATEDRFLATPTARAKRDLREGDLISVNLAGQTKSGSAPEYSRDVSTKKSNVFSEWVYHAEIYKQRKDIHAVVHAHPPWASSFGLAGKVFELDFWPEALVTLGQTVPCVLLGLPDHKESIVELGKCSKKASACLMQGNGAFAWGTTLEQAYLRLELVEHLCQIFMLSLSYGTLQKLPSNTVQLLLEKRKKAGLFSPEEVAHV